MITDPFYLAVGGTTAVLAVAGTVGAIADHVPGISSVVHSGVEHVTAGLGSAVTWLLLAVSGVELWVLLHLAGHRKGGA